MKIDSSYIGMESARTYTSSTTRKLSFRVQVGVAGSDSGVSDGLENGLGTEDSLKNQKEGGEGSLADIQAQMSQGSNIRQIRQIDIREESNSLQNIRQQCIVYLWSIFFGEGKAKSLADKMGVPTNQNYGYSYSSSASWSATLSSSTGISVSTMKPVDLVPLNNMKITAQEETFYAETENTTFSTTGTVKTADGREISFNLDVGMSRSFSQYTNQTVTNVAKMCDPLVINLNGNIAEVSDQKFYFDLDADGTKEQISRLCEDSGYLALDKNGDGKINDGSELFGPKSGDGFADLAQYDEDGNGWIDENDEIWDKLKIWVQDENGNSQLYRLADKGVGAICLQKASTDFTQRDSQGEVSAAIRSTGIFLYENGNVGTMQHLDLASSKIAQYA